jgi:4-hydroxy-4-methyl-2-oxoglutarate aldolase
MIENPPLIKIKKSSSRKKPSQSQIKSFENIPTGFICDAMEGYGALSPSIKLLDQSNKAFHVVGPALTVNSGASDVLGLQVAISEISEGDIVVNSVKGWQETASAGDRIAGLIKNNGGKALITDGPIRDLNGFLDTFLPCFCTGINPNSPYNSGPATIGFPINISNVEINSGDIIIGDMDGVVIVPFLKIDDVISKLENIIKIENDMDKKVQDGIKISPKIQELLNSDKVKYYD